MASEGGWRELLEACSEGVAVSDDGRFVDVSDGFARLHGAAPGRLEDADWRRLYPEDTRERLEREVLADLDRGDAWRGTVTARGEDGATLEETLVVRGLADRRVAWAIRDVKRAEDTESGPTTARPYRTLVESFPNGAVSLFDTDLRYTVVEGRIFEELEFDPDEMEGELLVDAHTDAFVENHLHHYEAALAGESREFEFEFGGRWYRGHTLPVRDDEGRVVSGVAMTQDITALRDRERSLERRRDELATLDRINGLLQEITRELVESGSRTSVERTVCERLAGSELYDLAWIGEVTPDGTGLSLRTAAGDGDGYLERVTGDGDRVTSQGPAGPALEARSVRVATLEDPVMDPWRAAARERGFAAVAAVPLHNDGTTHGVLLLHTDREEGFTERERAGFDLLGHTVGFVVSAIRHRKLLFTDAVTELTFYAPEPDSAFSRAARSLGCELRLEGYVASGNRWALYVSVDGTDPEAVAAALAEEPVVERTRVLSGDGDQGRTEIVATRPPVLRAVTHGGVSVRTSVTDSDGVRMVVEAPIDADMRAVVARVRDGYPGAELVAKHERDREVTTLGRPDGILGELTERQREALEAAYRAGYFDWPRESSAQEVAASLDLAAATLHGHLRKAERTLLANLFETHPETD